MTVLHSFADLGKQLKKETPHSMVSAHTGAVAAENFSFLHEPKKTKRQDLPVAGSAFPGHSLESCPQWGELARGPAEDESADAADSRLFLEAVAPARRAGKTATFPPGFHEAFAGLRTESTRQNNDPQGGEPTVPPDPTLPNRPKTQKTEESLFARAMADVAPLTGKGREVPKRVETGKKNASNSKTALEAFLEGEFEFAVAHTDEYYEGFVVGIDPVLINKLRAGQYSPEGHIDLHGKNAEQAQDSLVWFIRNAYQRNMRTVLVVTGRGKNSPDGVGVLRLQLQEWLTRDPFKRVVLAFCTAKPCDGGPGAIYVLLRKFKKAAGKIVWEKSPVSDDM